MVVVGMNDEERWKVMSLSGMWVCGCETTQGRDVTVSPKPSVCMGAAFHFAKLLHFQNVNRAQHVWKMFWKLSACNCERFFVCFGFQTTDLMSRQTVSQSQIARGTTAKCRDTG